MQDVLKFMDLFKDFGSISGFRVELPGKLDCPVSHFGENLLVKDHVVPSHRHKTWELVLQMEASSRWSDYGRNVEIERGELLICPPGVEHSKSGKERTDFRICYVGCKMDPDIWPRLREHLSDERMTKIPKARSMVKYIHALHDELLFDQPLQSEGVMLAWKQLWIAVYRSLVNPLAQSNRELRWLAQRVRTLVEADPGEQWTLKTVSRFFGYAPNYFAGVFRRESGMSFHQYLVEARVKAAQAALEQGAHSITEVALSLGFSSSQHFSRVFAKKTGVTPSQWIREARLKPAGEMRGS